MKETHIYINGPIGDGGITAEYVRRHLDNSSDQVTVHIASPGGEVYEGYTIYNILKNSGKEITVVIEGLCASIATLVACAGNTIIINPTAEFMIHNPMAEIKGDADSLRKVADQLDKIKQTIIDAYRSTIFKRTQVSKTDTELWDMMNAETFLTAEETKKMGFADEVRQGIKMYAFLDISKIKIEKSMDNNLVDKLNAFAEKLEGIFKSKPKNLDATLENGQAIQIDTEDMSDIKGKAVVIVTEAGPEAAPDGEHTLSDGRVIVVADGIITEVKEAAAEEAADPEALKAEIETLKAQLAEKTNEIENSKKETETIKAEAVETKAALTEVKNEFERIRNTIAGSGKDPKKVFVNKQDGKIGNDYLEAMAKKFKN